MSEIAESIAPREIIEPQEPLRDMSRARWQASEAAVVFTRVADVLFADGPVEAPNMEDVKKYGRREHRFNGVDVKWYQAHDVLLTMLERRAEQAIAEIPKTANANIYRHTHYGHMIGRPYPVVTEGIKAQVSFTLNIAQLVSIEAGERGVEGFATDTYQEIAQVIRRPDVTGVVHTALFTRNGIWGGLASFKGLRDMNRDHSGRQIDYFVHECKRHLQFDSDGNVSLDPVFVKLLHTELRTVNKKGNSSAGIMSTRTSSGCPVRHKKPHFSDSQADQQRIQELSEAYGVSPEELLQERETTVVTDGIRMMAAILDEFEAYTSGRKTTYSSSGQYPKSTDQPSAAQA